jgi:hypothetical protein
VPAGAGRVACRRQPEGRDERERARQRIKISRAQRRLAGRRTLTGARKPESSGILKKFRGRCAGLKAQGGRASRPPRVGFVGGTPTLLEGAVFSNSRAKAEGAREWEKRGRGSHGGTETRRKSVVAMAVLCRAKGNAEVGRCPRMDANPREWKTRVGSDRRTRASGRWPGSLPKAARRARRAGASEATHKDISRAAPPGGKKDSQRDAGTRKPESGCRKSESSGILKKFRGRCDMATPL